MHAIESKPRLIRRPKESTRPAAVRAEGLGLSIGGKRVLDGITLEIPAGSCIGVLGANGAGKSSLLFLLGLLYRPTSGVLEVLGKDGASAGRGVRGRIGLVAHQPMLYRELSTRENLEFFGRLCGVAGARARASELVDRLGLAGRQHEPVRQLSRGMQQRAAVARAVVHGPSLLLADEPFTGLDAESAATLETFFHDLGSDGTTIIMTGHDVERSLRLAGRVVVLREGRVQLDVSSLLTDRARVLAAAGGTA